MNTILLIIHLSYVKACWIGKILPPMVDRNIVDDALLPPVQPLGKKIKHADYLSKRPWHLTPTGEVSWPGTLCKKWGGGTRQSPIDIPEIKAIRDFEQEFIKYGPLVFTNYDAPMSAHAFNNGNTVQFIPTTINNLEPTVTGGPLDAVYRLEQIHYHWPSEHAINGHKYPMEIHFVHIRRELDVEAALKEVDGLAILVVFWNLVLGWEQPVLKDEDMPYFANLSVPGTQLKDVILNIGSLIRTNHRSYFTYSGSLSSPECQECVTWIIFETPLLVPENLYRAFGFLGVQRNNYRSTQELNKHRIFRTVNKAIMTPLLADTFADIGTVLTQIVKSYTGKAYNWSGRVAKAAFMAFKPGHDILGRQESGRQPIFDRKDIGDSEEDYPNIKVDTGLDDLEFKPGIEDTDKDDFLNNDEPENGKINGGEPSSKDSHEDADDLHMMDFDNLVRHAKSSK